MNICQTCGKQIEQYHSEIYGCLRWRHVALTPDGHIPRPVEEKR